MKNFYGCLICVCVLFTVPHIKLHADDEFDKILKHVQENEELYKDIDVKLVHSFASRNLHSTNSNSIKEDKNIIWFVNQSGKYRVEAKTEKSYADGEAINYEYIKISDGEVSKVLDQEKIANIIQGYSPDKRHIRPHMFFLRRQKFFMDLSTYLSGHEAMAASPLVTWKEGRTLENTYEGEVIYRGLKCHKVWITNIIKGKPYNRWELWLAEERNYIPVRMFAYTFRTSKEKPVGEAEVLEWEEVEPGIWFPQKTNYTAYSQSMMRMTGKNIVTWNENYTTDKISLNPQYDISFFQNINIPDGVAVYKIADNKIKKSYKKGALADPKVSATPPNLWWKNTYIIINGLFILILMIYMIWKKSVKQNETSPK